ncbi:MAG: copper chaperone PCu(A)C [Xanthomonadales bacterium]|nr:copper chaperone PCu(A)C [Xanthomonadales bacterium]
MRYVTCVLVGFGLAVLAAAGSASAASLRISDAWIRSAPPGAQVMGGFATLVNEGETPVTVQAVQSDAFGRVEIHETTTEAGVSKMRELPRLALEPGATVRLEPGGKHLMLMQPRRGIAAGERVEVVFQLGDGSRVEAPFEVRAADAMDAGHAGHHGHTDHSGHGHD